MPNSRAQLKSELDEAQETISQVSDLVDEALDPELSREELVSKVKEISDLVGEEEDADESGDQGNE
jgi:hypothetical protein